MEWAIWALSKASQNFFVWRCTLKSNFTKLSCHDHRTGKKKQIDLDILSKFALHSCTISRVNSSFLEKNVWFVWLPIFMISWISLKCLGLQCILTRTYCLFKCCNNKIKVPSRFHRMLSPALSHGTAGGVRVTNSENPADYTDRADTASSGRALTTPLPPKPVHLLQHTHRTIQPFLLKGTSASGM